MRIDQADPASVQPCGAELTRKAIAEHEALDRLLSVLLVAYPDRFPVPTGGSSPRHDGRA